MIAASRTLVTSSHSSTAIHISIQTCNSCKVINPLVKDLKLREWSCPMCNSYNLRDKNAALNILSEGLRLIAADGASEAQNACGELVSPGVIKALDR